MTHPLAPIVVGIDGSAGGLLAVRWAAAEASMRQRPLSIVHAFIWPLMGVPLGPASNGPQDAGLRHEAEGFVGEAVAHARSTAPDVDVTGKVVTGPAIPTLVAESADAELMVVGSRGLGGFSGLLVGSVGVGTAAHASCPVVVVRPTAADHGDEKRPVVVGFDGSAHSSLATTFAFEEAALRGLPLVVVHTWTAPSSVRPGEVLPLVYDPLVVEQTTRRELVDQLAPWQQKFAEVDVRFEVEHARPARTLLQQAKHAELVVVGSRGRGGFRGLLLGSVSQALVHHATCPAAVIRERP